MKSVLAPILISAATFIVTGGSLRATLLVVALIFPVWLIAQVVKLADRPVEQQDE
jgi:hypothetical protein